MIGTRVSDKVLEELKKRVGAGRQKLGQAGRQKQEKK